MNFILKKFIALNKIPMKKLVFVSLSIFGNCLMFASSGYSQTRQHDRASNFPGALSFYVVGDWGRDGKRGQLEVSEAMNKTTHLITPKFIISTGDNFYPDGVKTVDDKQWQTSFEKVYTADGLQCPWYVVLGNHDYHSNPQAEVEYSKTNKRWQMPSRYYLKS